MSVAVKKYSFNENADVKLAGEYAIVNVATDPPGPMLATVSTRLAVPPNLLDANVMVFATAYPLPPEVTPTSP